MALKRNAGGGFTLTEVLMAVGILGVGLAMVGTIFPVALNQARRSEETTRAALCARSVAAMMRARRHIIAPYLHTKTGAQPISFANVVYLGTPVIPEWSNVYHPGEFLYRATSTRTYDGLGCWTAGGYTTKITSWLSSDKGKRGPWKICLFVHKAPRGSETTFALWTAAMPAGVPRPGPGEYVFDLLTGDGYMIDRVDDNKTAQASPADTAALADDKIYVATGKLASGTPPAEYFTASAPRCFQGSTAAYHTIIGD
jgi:prepilin-type N-terminal cleavage/methylation domain-containing protein